MSLTQIGCQPKMPNWKTESHKRAKSKLKSTQKPKYISFTVMKDKEIKRIFQIN